MDQDIPPRGVAVGNLLGLGTTAEILIADPEAGPVEDGAVEPKLVEDKRVVGDLVAGAPRLHRRRDDLAVRRRPLLGGSHLGQPLIPHVERNRPDEEQQPWGEARYEDLQG
jgi:hypothetical protein